VAVLTAQRGLVTLSSELSRPDGAMVVADNVVIDADNTVQQRRGYRDYSQEFSSPVKQLMKYKNRLIAHYENILSLDNSSGSFSNFNGNFEELVQGLRLKYLEANGNLYFTTSSGIKKISAKDSASLTTSSVSEAGGVKAVDLSGKAIPDSSGFLPPESKVSYKILFGIKDASSNLILGVPSSRTIITNISRAITQSEIFTVNIANYSAITDGSYFLFSVQDKGYFVWFNKTGSGLAPINADTIDRQEIEVNIASVTSNASVAAVLANSMSSVANTDISIELTLAELQVRISKPGDVSDASQGSLSPSVVAVTKIFDGSITEGSPAKAELSFTIPDRVTTEYFYQIYRTGIETVSVGVSINDIDPGDEHQFVYEAPVTASDITAGEITVEDNTPDTFRQSGAYLYINPTNGQGILQANERPPIATDIASFRNSTFYGNTKDIHRLTFSVLSVDDFVSGTTKLYIGQGNKATHYTFVGQKEVTNVQAIIKNDTLGNSYFTLNSANDERSYYFWFDKGTLTQSFNSTSAVSGNSITINNHGLTTNDIIRFSGVVPGGLTAGTSYYAIRINSNTIKVSSTISGSEITLTTTVGDASISHIPQDPGVVGKLGIRIPLELYDNTLQGSATALIDAILALSDFSVQDLGSGLVQVTCDDSGNASAPTSSTLPSGWTTTVITEGDGEDIVINEVLLSLSSSTAIAIDLTARSLVKTINRDHGSPVIASYLSGPDDLPGKILLEAKSLEDQNFYVAISDASLTMEFSPELAVRHDLASINEVTNTFTTSAPHTFVVGDEIYIHDNPGSTHTEISGSYTIATVPTSTTFTLTNVDLGIPQAGPLNGDLYLTKAASDNNKVPNRVYYSKTLQPESVPISNYIDVGSKDKEILRILALRDNLFVLKEDGIYIVTGQAAPNFSVRLLDNSAILTAPDTAVVLNNLIYCLTTQGAVTISETGVSIISRPIENLIKQVTTHSFQYKYSSFGVAYESDRAYLLWLPTTAQDTVATQCFRYNSITNTWTRWTKKNTCGLVNLADDRMYLGGGDRAFIEQERKNNEREDYADRDFTRSINASAFSTTTSVVISSAVDVLAGDVIVQEQYLTVRRFNRLLKTLSKDNGTVLTDYTDLSAAQGDNLSTKLLALIQKLNIDPGLYGLFTLPSEVNTVSAIKTDFNLLITELNGPASGTSLKSYKKANDKVIYEALITKVEPNFNRITLNFPLPYVQGSIQVYKAIKSEIQWAPQHFGKPEILKQVHEGSLIFDQGTIYSGIVSYSSDRSVDFVDIPFTLSGPGFWASYPWADTVWGGGGKDSPLRTLVPVNKSRCRYINVKFKHQNAREAYKLVGVSLEPREVSTRGYR
jgi:hypothetical protein